MGLRSEIKAHLEGALGDGTFVYDAGAEVVSVPAVVLFPSNPYLAITTMKAGDGSRVTTALEFNLVASRTDPSAALDQLEDLRYAVSQALLDFVPRIRWTAFGSFAATEIGGTEYATATLETITVDIDRGATTP